MTRSRVGGLLVALLVGTGALSWPGAAPAQTLPTASVTTGSLGIVAFGCSALEASVASDASFVVTLAGDHTAAVDVNLSWEGTAVAGTDYTNHPSSVTFPPATSTVTVPVGLAVSAGGKTIVLTVNAGTGYVAGDPASATAIIAIVTPGCVAPPPTPSPETSPLFTG